MSDSFKRLLIFILFFSFVLFFGLQKVQASDSDIVINEVMVHPSSPQDKNEWIELYNNSSKDIDINGWTLKCGSSSEKTIIDTETIIAGHDYLILARDKTIFHGFPVIQVDMGRGLTDGGSSVILANNDGNSSVFTWSKDSKIDYSWERISPEESDIQESYISDGTPGEENSSKKDIPAPLAATDLKTDITGPNSVDFSWENTDKQKLSFTLLLWQNEDKSDQQEIDCSTTKSYSAKNLEYGDYHWQITSANENEDTTSDIQTFTLEKPDYSKNIIINEISPHPGTGTDDEFIELTNTGDDEVDLTGWFLDDAEGGSTPYEIPSGNKIGPDEFLVFYKIDTKLSLNDAGDSARLLFPDETVASSQSYTDAPTDQSWARDVKNVWSWTEKITPKATNIIYLTPKPVAVTTEEDVVVINKTPIKIKTGKTKNYKNKLVEVEATVVETSGRTFYLDDGSGKAKIYIQTQTKIQKPPMHKGDIFGLIGVVNLYRETWRILPRDQEDIWLIESATKKSVALAKTTPKKIASTSNEESTDVSAKTNQARAPNLLNPIGEVKAAEAANIISTENNATNTPWWLNLIETLIGLAIIFMVILVIKIKQRPHFKVIGGNFGNDDT